MLKKKRFDIVSSALLVGQLSANASPGGVYNTDLTPTPAQGVTAETRNGSSIKIVSAYAKFQFWQQSANNHNTRGRIELWHTKGTPTTSTILMQELYLPNSCVPGANVYDYNSERNPDYYGTAKRICVKQFKVNPIIVSQINCTDVAIPLKFNHHIRFSDNTQTVADGQIIMFIFLDSGNISTLSTLTGIPVVNALSGLVWNMDMKWYYVDN